MEILSLLGVDASILNQFVIAILVFILAKVVLFNKLKEVVETRESKTIALDEKANKNFDQANEVIEKYKRRLDEAYKKAKVFVTHEKEKVIKREEKTVKDATEQTEKHFLSAKSEFEKEVSANRQQLLAEVDSLAGSLVDKVTK